MVVGIVGILFLIPLVLISSTSNGSDKENLNRYQKWFVPCTLLYKEAQTHSDTLSIHTYLPYGPRYPNCLTMKFNIDSLQKIEVRPHGTQ